MSSKHHGGLSCLLTRDNMAMDKGPEGGRQVKWYVPSGPPAEVNLPAQSQEGPEEWLLGLGF